MADKVVLPASVGAAEPLTVAVSVTVGGCRGFRRFAAQRTANTLRLQVIGQETVGYGFACTADIRYETHSYTDPGTPARTGPFEVIVNGKAWGTVQIK